MEITRNQIIGTSLNNYFKISNGFVVQITYENCENIIVGMILDIDVENQIITLKNILKTNDFPNLLDRIYIKSDKINELVIFDDKLSDFIKHAKVVDGKAGCLEAYDYCLKNEKLVIRENYFLPPLKKEENRWRISDELKNKYLNIVKNYLDNITEDNCEPLFLSDTELNPAKLETILEELGYDLFDNDMNGWEMDFSKYYKNEDDREIMISGCGMTFELILQDEIYYKN